jgi:hypothetical protein
MKPGRRLLRSIGTSIVALFLVAGAALATTSFVGGARHVDSQPAAAGEATGDSPEATPETGAETGSEEPASTVEGETQEPGVSTGEEDKDQGDDATGSASEDPTAPAVHQVKVARPHRHNQAAPAGNQGQHEDADDNDQGENEDTNDDHGGDSGHDGSHDGPSDASGSPDDDGGDGSGD